MEPTRWLAVAVLLGLPSVAFGGWALLTHITGKEGLSPAQQRFFRDGHAHAGVLLVLSLVYVGYLDETGFSEGLQWAAGLTLLVGVMAQSGGFFLHMAAADTHSPSAGTKLTRAGALLIGAALFALAIGLIVA
ncbi:MAG TPA: hypothetical protein VFW48_07095 [Solirubrobacterales bacterium]|nr:hypothetical protein [Solirubrobacterales bacterium]